MYNPGGGGFSDRSPAELSGLVDVIVKRPQTGDLEVGTNAGYRKGDYSVGVQQSDAGWI